MSQTNANRSGITHQLDPASKNFMGPITRAFKGINDSLHCIIEQAVQDNLRSL